jgi:hypothetical protein
MNDTVSITLGFCIGWDGKIIVNDQEVRFRRWRSWPICRYYNRIPLEELKRSWNWKIGRVLPECKSQILPNVNEVFLHWWHQVYYVDMLRLSTPGAVIDCCGTLLDSSPVTGHAERCSSCSFLTPTYDESPAWANWINSRGKPTRGGPPACDVGEALKVLHLKGTPVCSEMLHWASELNRFVGTTWVT